MGVYLSQPNTKKDSEVGEGNGVRYCAAGMQGWRTNMEDSHISSAKLTDDISVFGVFDGHGGKEVAKFVSQNFCQELLKNKNFQTNNFEEALKETFLQMDKLLLTTEGKKKLIQIKNEDKDADDYEEESFAGCTANVALIYKGKELYVANAGDSRCILSCNNKAEEMSIDHKPDLEVERNRIIKAGGYISDGRINSNLNLSRAIGDLEYKRDNSRSELEQLIIAYPDVKKKTLDMTQDQFLLLGCDGVWESLTNQEIIDYIREKLKSTNNNLKEVIESLLDKLLAPDTSNGLGCDNMTAVLVTFQNYKNN